MAEAHIDRHILLQCGLLNVGRVGRGQLVYHRAYLSDRIVHGNERMTRTSSLFICRHDARCMLK